MEKWLAINGFPNYNVSTFGNIQNNKTNKMLRLCVKGGYCNISLVNENGQKTFKVHRLVALAFIANPENKSDVNHKDKNKINNNLDNLEWMTRRENNTHRCKDVVITTNKNKVVSRIDCDTNDILESYNSIELAGNWAFENGYTKTIHNGRNSIGNCLKGLSKCAYKYKWKYDNTYDDLEEEIWKQVVLDGVDIKDKKYYVSNLGRYKNSSGIISDNYKVNDNGYIKVFIINRTYSLHRLVALMFIENIFNKTQVNHIDGVKLNNSVANLEWVSNQENQIHKHKIGLGNNFTRKISQYDLNMNKINNFGSISAAARELNINKSCIQGVITNRYKTAGGFIFKYIEDLAIYKPVKLNLNRGRKIIQYDLDMNVLCIHDSMSIAGRNLNIHKNHIWAVINNKKKMTGGFIFKYLEETL